MATVSSTARFYTDLPTFDDFSKVAYNENYTPAPEDWFVFITDIEDSTSAINQGRYKEVNMIGAASINALLNICDEDEIPYVFGGDGATMLVPPERKEACIRALLGVKYISQARFDLKLRIGVVAVAEINRVPDCRVLVGKYRLSPNNLLATYSGGGVEHAEHWIKTDSRYLVEDDIALTPDLSGLSCRWEPLASEKGVMLSILVQVIEGDGAEVAVSYGSVIQAIGEITSGIESAKPTRDSNLKLKWPSSAIAAEIDTIRANGWRPLWVIRVYFLSLYQWLLDRFNKSAHGYRGKQYRVELKNNTDYRRFDDTLRILLDCSVEQADKVGQMLDDRAQKGELIFGTHRADSALMTCLVFNLEKSQHIHFVDGNDGGFTSAAKALKQRFRSSG